MGNNPLGPGSLAGSCGHRSGCLAQTASAGTALRPSRCCRVARHVVPVVLSVIATLMLSLQQRTTMLPNGS